MSYSGKVERVVFGRLAPDTDMLEGVKKVLQRENIRAGYVNIIGALKSLVVGYFDQATRTYAEHRVDGPAEILICTGNVSLLDGAPFPHLHLTAGDPEGRAMGGHLMPGCRVFVAEYSILAFADAVAERKMDEASGLMLWPADKPDA